MSNHCAILKMTLSARYPSCCLYMFPLPIWSHLEMLWKRGDSSAVVHSSQEGCGGCGLSWVLQPQVVWLQHPNILPPYRGLSSWSCCLWVALEGKTHLGHPSQKSESGLERQVRPLESQEEKESIAKALKSKWWCLNWPRMGTPAAGFCLGWARAECPSTWEQTS